MKLSDAIREHIGQCPPYVGHSYLRRLAGAVEELEQRAELAERRLAALENAHLGSYWMGSGWAVEVGGTVGAEANYYDTLADWADDIIERQDAQAEETTDAKAE